MASLTRIPGKMWMFLKEARLELIKTSWPTRQELIRYTLAVVIASTALALFLGGLDILLSSILSKFILKA